MKKAKNILLLIIMMFAFTIIGSKVYALQITDNRVVDKNKDWTVRFSDNICLDDLTKNAIVIKDMDGNTLKLNISLCADGKSILIIHPYNGYTPGQDYTLYLGTNIHSTSGKRLRQQQVLHFGVPWLPIEDDSVSKITLCGKSGRKDASKDEQANIIKLLNSINSYDHYDYEACLQSWPSPVSAIDIYTKDNNIIEIRDGGYNDNICINYEYYAKQPELKQILNKLLQ